MQRKTQKKENKEEARALLNCTPFVMQYCILNNLFLFFVSLGKWNKGT